MTRHDRPRGISPVVVAAAVALGAALLVPSAPTDAARAAVHVCAGAAPSRAPAAPRAERP